jgi:DNA-binding HxlR family transcriptional regulator
MREHRPLCPYLDYAFQLLGKRWNGLIIYTLLDGPKRFKEISDSIPPLSDKMLTERIRELETEEVISRTVFPERPVRIEYSLTDKGRALKPALDALSLWSKTWSKPFMTNKKTPTCDE